MTSLQGFVIIALMPVTHFSGKWMYRRGYIAVTLPGESEVPRGKGGSG
jgi:hypothetical protein